MLGYQKNQTTTVINWDKMHTPHTGIHPHALPNVITGIRPSLLHVRHFSTGRIKTLNETCQRNGTETNQINSVGNISRGDKSFTIIRIVICVSRIYGSFFNPLRLNLKNTWSNPNEQRGMGAIGMFEHSNPILSPTKLPNL
jgi:hypothetical protein